MRNSRPDDKLNDLITNHFITTEQKKDWKELRNAIAHANYEKLGSIQDLLTLSRKVLALFYQLVFLLIDYRGAYTDYGTVGWPVRTRDIEQ